MARFIAILLVVVSLVAACGGSSERTYEAGEPTSLVGQNSTPLQGGSVEDDVEWTDSVYLSSPIQLDGVQGGEFYRGRVTVTNRSSDAVEFQVLARFRTSVDPDYAIFAEGCDPPYNQTFAIGGNLIDSLDLCFFSPVGSDDGFSADLTSVQMIVLRGDGTELEGPVVAIEAQKEPPSREREKTVIAEATQTMEAYESSLEAEYDAVADATAEAVQHSLELGSQYQVGCNEGSRSHGGLPSCAINILILQHENYSVSAGLEVVLELADGNQYTYSSGPNEKNVWQTGEYYLDLYPVEGQESSGSETLWLQSKLIKARILFSRNVTGPWMEY